ncbi:SMAD/FHA domain-containing protein [Cadophora sp. DSE1049]|nr:SMAD/FHA domain-containing protein [Cadophora sp. DSE1049]
MDRHSGRDRERDRDRERREKSRSVSYDSEEERRRRRRRERREKVVGERDSKRRRTRSRSRSRSPAHESSRRSDRDRDRDSKHRSTRERSPYRSSSGRDKDKDREREGSGSATQGPGQLSRKAKGPLPSQASSFQANGGPESASAVVVAEEKDKQKPNFASTGLLAAASNSVTQADGSAIALKYHEPAEARKPPPRDDWKLFVFKGPEILETIDLSLRSCWLVGREVAVVDLPAEHPSVSKQHAVIQFRYIEKKNEFGDKTGRVRPYLIDLDSANGTALNKEEIPPSRYLELRDKDMVQFGHSTREYVLMLSKS